MAARRRVVTTERVIVATFLDDGAERAVMEEGRAGPLSPSTLRSADEGAASKETKAPAASKIKTTAGAADGKSAALGQFGFAVLMESGERLVFVVDTEMECRAWVACLRNARYYARSARRSHPHHPVPELRRVVSTAPISSATLWRDVVWVGDGVDSVIRSIHVTSGQRICRYRLSGPAARSKVSAMAAFAAPVSTHPHTADDAAHGDGNAAAQGPGATSQANVGGNDLLFLVLHSFVYVVDPRQHSTLLYWNTRAPITRMSLSASALSGRRRVWVGTANGRVMSWPVHDVVQLIKERERQQQHSMCEVRVDSASSAEVTLPAPPRPSDGRWLPSTPAAAYVSCSAGDAGENVFSMPQTLRSLDFSASATSSPSAVVALHHTRFVMWIATDDGRVRAWNEGTLCYLDGMEVSAAAPAASLLAVAEESLWVSTRDRVMRVAHFRR